MPTAAAVVAPPPDCERRRGDGAGAIVNFGRAALGLARDVGTLFDPLNLLTEPRQPLPARQPRIGFPSDLSRCATSMEPHARGRADSDAQEAQLWNRWAQEPSASRDSMTRLFEEPVQVATSFASNFALGGLTDADIGVPGLTAGGNDELAARMLAPTHCLQRAPTRQRIEAFTQMLDSARWQDAGKTLARNSAGGMVLLALSLLKDGPSRGDRKHGGAVQGLPMGSVVIGPSQMPPVDGALPMAIRRFPEFDAAVACGSTYFDMAPTAPLHLQDGIFLTRHATVVVDGLAGHSNWDHAKIRVAQSATGAFVSSLVEALAIGQRRPAQYLRDHGFELVRMLDLAVRSAVFALSDELGLGLKDLEARAAFTAVARFQDGVVVFGVGDCTAHVFQRGPQGRLQLRSFTPQPGKVSPGDVGGLGEGKVTRAQFGLWHTAQVGQIERVAVGSDGVFNGEDGFVQIVDGRTPAQQPARQDQLGVHSLGEATHDEACEEIITRLTARARAEVALRRSEGGRLPPEFDDVGLVVRDLNPPSAVGVKD